MSPELLERRLQALAADIDWPATVDVADSVTTRIATRPGLVRPPWTARLRPVMAAAAAFVAIAAAVLVVSPGARSAVASWFGLGGVAVERTTEPARPQTQDLNLGEPVTAQEAAAVVDFSVQGLPFENPRHYLDRTIEGGMVSLVYPPQAGAPATSAPGVGAILTQFDADPSDPSFTKEVSDGQNVQFVDVAGGFGMWVSGPSHMLLRTDDGEPLRHTARLSANALVWTTETGLTYRLESALSLEQSLELAEMLE